MEKIYNLLHKYQAYLLGIGIFLMLLSVSIKFNESDFDLVFKNHPRLVVFLLALGLVTILLYIQIDKYKLDKLNKEIKGQKVKGRSNISALLDQLTKRQKEVYDMIIQGKSNKEIMAELYIEASTLKTHINQIYKKMKIKNRKELKKLHNEEESLK